LAVFTLMSYFTYILKSKVKDRFYIGSTDNLERRLILHNEGNTISTKAYIPWELVYYEIFESKSEALKREIHLKRMKSKKYIQWLIQNPSGGRPD
jgi:putative endonuclease